MSVEINGLEVLLGRLGLFTDMETLQAGLNKATLAVERSAKMKAPKGEIAQSITSKVEDFTGIVYTPHRLAPYIEWGTGLFSEHPKGGRKEVPWVYVEGQYNEPSKKTIHTEESAEQTVAMMRSEGIPAVKTYGSKPMPYMRPALDENREYILKVLGDALLND